jgi:hypothetical protein
LNQKHFKNLNSRITSSEVEAVIKSSPTKKSPGLDGFMSAFYQTPEEEQTPIFLKLFQKIERKGTLPNSSFQNPIKTQPGRELKTNIFNECRCKDSEQNTGKQNSTTRQKDHSP